MKPKMKTKIVTLVVILTLTLTLAAMAQKSEVITGTISNVTTSVTEGKYDVLLSLEGRPETFQVTMADAPRFGLTKGVIAASGPEFLQMLQDMEAAKGWKVKLTCVKTGNPKGPEFLVQSLEKLAGK